MEQPLDHSTMPALAGSSRARDHSGTRFPGIIWALVTVGAAITAWYVVAPADHPAHRLVGNALFTLVPALAAHLCFGAASRSRRSAQSWRLIGFACVAWLAGQLVWNVYEIVLLQSPPFPSLADVGYILFYPLCAAGLIQLIRDASLQRGAEVMLDGLIISAVAALLSFEVLLVPSLDTGLTDPVVTLASVIWQVGIVGLVILGALAFIMHARSRQRWPVGALLVGLLSFAIADLVYGQAAYEGSYSVGSPLDLSWHFGFLFVGLGAVLAGRQADNGPQREQLVGVGWRQAGSIISVLAFGGLAAYAALDRTSHVLLAIGSAAVAIALALRLAYSAQQAQRLARRTRERDRLSAEVAAREATQTEMAAALAAQRTAYRELERLNRTKSEFVTVVSHEFRTPLTSIQGFADLIRDEDLTEDEVKDFAGIVGENARRLARLIDDMLDIDRLESGQVKCDHQALELNAIVTDVADSLRATSQHRIELEIGAAATDGPR